MNRRFALYTFAAFCLSMAALLVAGTSSALGAGNKDPRIGIVYTSPHPVINDIIVGFKAVVLRSYPKAIFMERHANGREEEYGTAVSATIASQPDLIAPITTPIARLTLDQARGRIPVIFMGITDPVGAGLARSLEHPVVATGSSDLCPFSGLLNVVRQTLPHAKRLGLPYNPTDQPAVFSRSQLLALAPKYGFTIVDEQVTSASELSTQVRGLATRVDAVVIGADNLMMENPAAVASAAADVGKPTFACDEPSVKAGAVAGIGVSYRQVGELAGDLAVKVLKGKVAGELPVAVLRSGIVSINRQAACKVRLNIPAAVASKATDDSPANFRCVVAH
ncbi:MAG: ABC transporter substrate-binding protein [Proteobacteria bacterium]|nr:ABC transporter substrate-binding protein [Pseudomonadota bacterium]